MATLREVLDSVAYATCIMAVGLEPPRLFKGAAGHQHASAPPDASGLAGGKEPLSARGAVDRLVKLLDKQLVQHKMVSVPHHHSNGGVLFRTNLSCVLCVCAKRLHIVLQQILALTYGD